METGGIGRVEVLWIICSKKLFARYLNIFKLGFSAFCSFHRNAKIGVFLSALINIVFNLVLYPKNQGMICRGSLVMHCMASG